MATYLKIVLLTCLLMPMVAMEDVQTVAATRGRLQKERTKKLEESMRELKEMMKEQEERINKQEEMIKALEECKACSKITELNKTLSELQEKEKIDSKPAAVYKDCAGLYDSGNHNSSVYTINPDDSDAFDVFCDQTTAGGEWTVFQKRQDGSVDFYRDWADYKRGFGNLDGEFWLGLEKIHRLTSSGQYTLRVDLEDWAGNTAYAEYDSFTVADEGNEYQLSVGSYSGTAGDSLAYHNSRLFTTKDVNNGVLDNCAERYKGGWWYNNCYHSNLNGIYRQGEYTDLESVNWYHWKEDHRSLKKTEMKMRPVNF